MSKKGFTLIEVLLGISLVAILSGITLSAINPASQFEDTNNVMRRSHVNAILSATAQYALDNRGVFPAEIGVAYGYIGNDTAGGEIDICDYLVPDYLAEMPADPTDASAGYVDCTNYYTGYEIMVDAISNRLSVRAPNAEDGETIEILQ